MKKHIFQNYFLSFLIIFLILFLMPIFVYAQNNFSNDSVQMIETEIGIDQIVGGDDNNILNQEVPFLSAKEKQMMQINKSLKALIDENQKLTRNNEEIQVEVERLRGERMIQDSRLNVLAGERKDLLKKFENANAMTRDYEKQLQDLTTSVEKTKGLSAEEIRSLTELDSLIEKDQTSIGTEAEPQAVERVVYAVKQETESSSILSKETIQELSDLMQENQVLRKDTIRLHYNLANLFFEQGEYEMAAAEYNRVLDLMPQDAATHFNLAFVSEEYLDDYKTALEHYKKYLIVSPNAKDAGVVKNRIVKLKLKIRNKINSMIDREKP